MDSFPSVVASAWRLPSISLSGSAGMISRYQASSSSSRSEAAFSFLARLTFLFLPARLESLCTAYVYRAQVLWHLCCKQVVPPPPSGSAQPTGSHIVHLSERAKTKLVAGLQCLLQRPSMRARQYSMNLDWPAVRDGSVTSDQGALRPREIMVAVETFRSSSPENLVDKVEEWFDGVRGVVNIFQGLSTAGREETAPVDEAPLY